MVENGSSRIFQPEWTPSRVEVSHERDVQPKRAGLGRHVGQRRVHVRRMGLRAGGGADRSEDEGAGGQTEGEGHVGVRHEQREGCRTRKGRNSAQEIGTSTLGGGRIL